MLTLVLRLVLLYLALAFPPYQSEQGGWAIKTINSPFNAVSILNYNHNHDDGCNLQAGPVNGMLNKERHAVHTLSPMYFPGLDHHDFFFFAISFLNVALGVYLNGEQ